MACALATYLRRSINMKKYHSSIISRSTFSISKHGLLVNDYTLLTRSMEMRCVHKPAKDGIRTGFYWLTVQLHSKT
ncbi:hypothetical protein BT93_B2202 [Corymbia citriodora subsp. variegata]|nr:hypothetical protein BT93_B2202 [Corymbia citriodora subsp. variegata]